MPPSLLFDISQIDLNQVVCDAQAIERVNPHRGAMRLLDGIHWHDLQTGQCVAYKDVKDDEFWVPGHIPGRPIFPGVLMIEAGAQLASYILLNHYKVHLGKDVAFVGFVACDEAKFRGQVVPGDRLLLLGSQIEFKPRRSICSIQGLVNDTLVFQAKITGMPM